MTSSNLSASAALRRFPPGRILVWGLFALLLLVAPQLFTSSFGITILSQMGMAIIACLSYNMLLGQGGMLRSAMRCTPVWAHLWRSMRSILGVVAARRCPCRWFH